MNLQSFYLIIIISIFCTGLSSSSCKNKGDKTANSFGTAKIKVLRNRVVLTEYTDTMVRATLDAGDLFAEFSSNDNDHVLSLTINNFQAGTFQVKDMYEAESAHLLYYSKDLPEFSPGNIGLFNFPSGTLKLDKVENNRCSGNFTATGVHGGDSQTYTVEGTFEMPYREI